MKRNHTGPEAQRYPGQDFVVALADERADDRIGTHPGTSPASIENLPDINVVNPPGYRSGNTRKQWRNSYLEAVLPPPYSSPTEDELARIEAAKAEYGLGRRHTAAIEAGSRLVDPGAERAVLGSRASRRT
jgi:hypothetical protein